jgi:hypothetical protein
VAAVRHRPPAPLPDHAAPPARAAPASAEGVLALQRTAGNRAVAELLGGGLAVQRAKTRAPNVPNPKPANSKENAELQMRVTLGGMADEFQKLYARKKPQDNNEGFQWLKAYYDAAVVKGDKIWKAQMAALGSYLDDPAEFTRSRQAERVANAHAFATHYASVVSDSARFPGATAISSSGFANAVNPAAPPALGQDPPYQNAFDFGTGAVHAPHEYATKDAARLAGVGLKNSEVIWQQYQMTVQGVNSPAPISKFVSTDVVNEPTKAVLLIAYDDDVAPWHGQREWGPKDPEFKALLGTPNVGAAAYMLIDHMDEMGGMTISRIRAVANGADRNIEIIYRRVEPLFEPRESRAGQASLSS